MSKSKTRRIPLNNLVITSVRLYGNTHDEVEFGAPYGGPEEESFTMQTNELRGSDLEALRDAIVNQTYGSLIFEFEDDD